MIHTLLRWVVALGAALGLVVAAVLAYGATQPTTWRVSVQQRIDAPPEVVHAWVIDLSTWPSWFAAPDPTGQTTYTVAGPGVGAGSSFAWKGNGSFGELTVQTATPGEGITYTLVMEASETNGYGSVRIEPDGDGSRVTWTDEGDMERFPVGGLMARMLEWGLEPHFGRALSELGELAEGGLPRPRTP